MIDKSKIEKLTDEEKEAVGVSFALDYFKDVTPENLKDKLKELSYLQCRHL